MRPTARQFEFASIPFLGLIAVLARASGAPLVLFPELGALAHDVLKRPSGAWARAPMQLVLTPLATAIIGIVISRAMDFGVAAVLLDVLASAMIIGWMRSPIAPAISAGLLPLVLGVTSPLYPLAISVGTTLLAAVVLVVAKYRMPSSTAAAYPGRDHVDNVMEAAPSTLGWVPAFFGVVALLASLAEATHLRFILFPPLVVIGFEMFAHSAVCPWIERPWRLPLACGLSSAGGLGLALLFGPGMVSVMLAMALGIAMLRLLDLHAPPVMAVGLLPMIMKAPGPSLILSVVLGSSLMMIAFAAWRRIEITIKADPGPGC